MKPKLPTIKRDTRVPDHWIEHEWIPNPDWADEPDFVPEPGAELQEEPDCVTDRGPVRVGPDFYARNGEPIAEDGEDMLYSATHCQVARQALDYLRILRIMLEHNFKHGTTVHPDELKQVDKFLNRCDREIRQAGMAHVVMEDHDASSG
jgi:hypothetical protein